MDQDLPEHGPCEQTEQVFSLLTHPRGVYLAHPVDEAQGGLEATCGVGAMNWHSLELSSFTHQAASHLRHQWVWPVSAGPTSASFSRPRSDTTQPPRAQRLDGHMVGHPPHPGCAPQLLSLPAFPHADHPQPPAGPLMLSDALSAQPRLCQPAGGTPDM